MRWPFVSRARFEDLHRQLTTSEDERRFLLAHVVEDKDARQPEQLPEPEAQTPTVNFITPIDRVLSNFDKARRNGPIPNKFKAKAR